MAKYEIPRGTRDFLPEEMAVRNHVEARVRVAFEAYGFQPVQTPTFELYDLFAARSGEEIRESMFTFASDAGRYALRPELTAPVCRLVASGALQPARPPYKLYYFGPVFRYCRPQSGRYREFYETGVELLGSADPLADAETVAVAVRALRNLGITGFTLKVGNVGILQRLLGEAANEAQQERQSHVLHDIDRLMHLRQKCGGLQGEGTLRPDDLAYLEAECQHLGKLQAEVGYAGPHALPAGSLTADKVREKSAVLPEIAEATVRAAWVARRYAEDAAAHRILQVAQLNGPAQEVLPRANQLLRGTPAEGPLADLAEVCGLLEAFGVARYNVALGTARNLDFYTGTVFEIDAPLGGSQKQVCGGGRYDRLIQEFGGPALPGTGFAFGFDRLVQVFRTNGTQLNTAAVDVVVAAPLNVRGRAAAVAEQLRDHGLRVAVDLAGQDPAAQVDAAKRSGADWAVILDVADQHQCKLRRLSSGVETSVGLAAAAEAIRRQGVKGGVS